MESLDKGVVVLGIASAQSPAAVTQRAHAGADAAKSRCANKSWPTTSLPLTPSFLGLSTNNDFGLVESFCIDVSELNHTHMEFRKHVPLLDAKVGTTLTTDSTL